MQHSQKEIAFQAGVSLATVDRVTHGRDGVKAATRRRVEAAIRELDRQALSHGLDGKRLALDVVIEAPERFSKAVRDAFEAETEGLRPASLRLRFHMAERFAREDLIALLRQIRRRGTQGLVLKLPDRADVQEQVARLIAECGPVVSFVTDLSVPERAAYIGMDNWAAGRVAAHLVRKTKPQGGEKVLATLSSDRFSGEAARIEAFRQAFAPEDVVVVQGGMGQDTATGDGVRRAVAGLESVAAVYSASGGNHAILAALDAAGHRPRVFVGHDLDRDNRQLLRDERIDFVIHHDLRNDARSAFQHVLRAHRLLPAEFEIDAATIQLATPFSVAV